VASYNLAPIANFVSIFGSNTAASTPNNPLAGGFIKTYAAGTTTPLQTYQTSTGTGWGTTITLDSTGRVPGEIWLPNGVAYKFVLQDSSGNVIPNGTLDNLYGINDTSQLSSNATEWIASGFTPTYSSTTQFTTTGNSTATFTVGRRIQETDSNGTFYGVVTASSYASIPNTTTVTVTIDAGGVLHTGMTAVNVSFIDANGTSNLLPGALTAAGLNSTGNLSASGTSTLTGAVAAPGGITGNVVGTATGLSGGYPALGTNWQVGTDGQIDNPTFTLFVAAYYNSSNQGSGSNVSMNTLIASQSGNFGISGVYITSAAAGLYEVTYTFTIVNLNASLYTVNLWFAKSLTGAIYGPTSASPFVTETTAAGIVLPITLRCFWRAAATEGITVVSNQTWSGNIQVLTNAQMTIRHIA